MICKNLGVNESGHLTFAGFDTVELAQKYGTALYLLDENRIREMCRTYVGAMSKYFGKGSHPHYASKALSFGGIYRIMKEENMGIDVVSKGEIFTAKKAGFPMENACFHGNAKQMTTFFLLCKTVLDSLLLITQTSLKESMNLQEKAESSKIFCSALLRELTLIPLPL